MQKYAELGIKTAVTKVQVGLKANKKQTETHKWRQRKIQKTNWKKKKRNNIKEIKTFIINKNKDSFPVNENKNKRTC